MPGRRLAITGATGFLGRHVVRAFLQAGWRVRILARRDPIDSNWPGEVELVLGDLGDDTALRALCRGADCIVHAAGLIKAHRNGAFARINVGGSVAVARAAEAVAPEAHVILVSSLTARAPELSAYALSKRDGEAAMAKVLGPRLSVVRPTAIYGPGDQETFPFIAAASRGWPLPVLDSASRLTMVHAGDVARDLLALADASPGGAPRALCDDRPAGYSWPELMTAIGAATGRKPRLLRVFPGLLRPVGWAGDLARLAGRPTIVSAGKIRELSHRDWSVSPEELGTPEHRPQFSLDRGLADTVAWARATGRLASRQA